MHRAVSIVGLVLLLVVLGGPTRGEEKAAATPEQLKRLATLCKVWGTIRYQHPFLACQDIDWDAALIKALPKVEAAKTPQEFTAAVQVMLDVLRDPATRTVRKAAAPRTKARAADAKFVTPLADSVLILDMGNWAEVARLAQDPKVANEFRAQVGKSGGVIVDCRENSFIHPAVLRILEGLLCPKEIESLGRRSIVHSGYRPQSFASSGGYYSAFEAEFGSAFTPAPKNKAPRSVFLVSGSGEVPDLALALQESGDGFIVVQGKASEDLVVPQRTLPLAEGFRVILRTGERVSPQGGAYSFAADAEVKEDAEAGPNGPACKSALGLLKDPKVSLRDDKARTHKPLPQAVWRRDKSYPDMKFPDREHRLLALFRFWTVIHYFYPYKHLLDADWDTVLPEFLPRFLAARDEREYALTVAEMATRVQDNHTHVVGSQELTKFFGTLPTPIQLRWIEKAPVITDLSDEKVAKEAGVQVGDVIVKVDGEPVAKRMERIGKYLAASTPHAHEHALVNRMLNGEEGSTCKLTIRGSDAKEKDVELPRRATFLRRSSATKREVFEILPDNLGYVDLTRLEPRQVDPMLEKLKDTKAIVFDMRGYPRGVFWLLAPRLNVKNAKYAAAFQRPLIGGLGGVEGNFSFLQPIDATDKWKYKGKTVMLIDERAISQSEHTGLFLEAASGVTFVGSHTQGANGDVTDLFLPGGLRVTFTGHDVRHADGRQLQRVGLVPHVDVKPTIKGIREGKDEVLDQAIKFVQEGK